MSSESSTTQSASLSVSDGERLNQTMSTESTRISGSKTTSTSSDQASGTPTATSKKHHSSTDSGISSSFTTTLYTGSGVSSNSTDSESRSKGTGLKGSSPATATGCLSSKSSTKGHAGKHSSTASASSSHKGHHRHGSKHSSSISSTSGRAKTETKTKTADSTAPTSDVAESCEILNETDVTSIPTPTPSSKTGGKSKHHHSTEDSSIASSTTVLDSGSVKVNDSLPIQGAATAFSALPTSTKHHHHSSNSSRSMGSSKKSTQGGAFVGANIGDFSLGLQGPTETGSPSSNHRHGASSTKGQPIQATSAVSAQPPTTTHGSSGLGIGLGLGNGDSDTEGGSVDTYNSTESAESASGPTVSSGLSGFSGDDGDILGGSYQSGSESGATMTGSPVVSSIVSSTPTDGFGASLSISATLVPSSGMGGLSSVETYPLNPSGGLLNSTGDAQETGLGLLSATSTPTLTSTPVLKESATALPTSTQEVVNSTNHSLSDVESSLSDILGFGSGVLDTSMSDASPTTALPAQDGENKVSKTSSATQSVRTGPNGELISSKDSYSESPLHDNGGAIAGVVIGAIVAVLVLVGVLIWYLRRRASSKKQDRGWDSMEAGRDALARQQAHYSYGGITSDQTRQGGNGNGNGLAGAFAYDNNWNGTATSLNVNESPLRIRNSTPTPRQELAQAFNSRSRSNTENSEMMENVRSKTPSMNDKDARGQPYSHTVHRDPSEVDPTMQAFAKYFTDDGRQPPPGSYRTFQPECQPSAQTFEASDRKPVPISKDLINPFADPESRPSIDSIGRGTSTAHRRSPSSGRGSESSGDSIGDVQVRGAQYVPAPTFNPKKNGGILPPHAAMMQKPSSYQAARINQGFEPGGFSILAGPLASRHHPRQPSVDARGADEFNGIQPPGRNWSPWKYQNGNSGNLSNLQTRVSNYKPKGQASSNYNQHYPGFASMTSPSQRPTSGASEYSQTSALPTSVPRFSSDPF